MSRREAGREAAARVPLLHLQPSSHPPTAQQLSSSHLEVVCVLEQLGVQLGQRLRHGGAEQQRLPLGGERGQHDCQLRLEGGLQQAVCVGG